jgi:Plasmid pRiA4b ORF-3-like protein
MAKTASDKVKKADIVALKNLPRNPELVLVGGRRALPLSVGENPLNEQPQLIFWLQAGNGRIRARRYVRPREGMDTVNEGLAALLTAIEGPFFPGADLVTGGLPVRIVTDDSALAEAATPLFAALKIPVELVPENAEIMTAYRKLLSEITSATGIEPQPVRLVDLKWTPGENPERLAELLRGANAGYRNFAENYLPSYWAFTVRLKPKKPQEPRQFWYCVLGDADLPGGYVFYNSLEDLVLDREFRRPLAEPSEEKLAALLDKLRSVPALGDKLFYLDELIAIAQNSTKPDIVTGVESYGVYYAPINNAPPQYIQWLRQNKLKYGSREGVPVFVHRAADGRLHPLNDKDAADIAVALPGAAEIFRYDGRFITAPHFKGASRTYEYKVETGKAYHKWDSGYGKLVNPVEVEVEYPAPGYQFPEGDEIDPKFDPNSLIGALASSLGGRIRADEDEDENYEPVITTVQVAPGHIVQYIEHPEVQPKHPASVIAATTVYRLKVTLAWEKSVWRRIEIRGDDTMHDLHFAIQHAFGWDNDHLYAFYMSNKRYDARTSYDHPELQGDGFRSDKYRIERVKLRPATVFIYLFDFGDKLEHEILVEDILPGGVEAGVEYPRIIEKHGKNLPQYSHWQTDDDEDEDENYDEDADEE